MKIYQPFVVIEDFFGNRASRFSRKVFLSRSQAMDAIPEFRDRLRRKDDLDLGYPEAVLRGFVVELEVVEVPE